MHPLVAVIGVMLLLGTLRDAFETVVLPRRVNRKFALTRFFYRLTWPVWRTATHRFKGSVREGALSWFGPVSLLALLAVWAGAIVFAFALLQWAAGSAVTMTNGVAGFASDLYLSGTTFFTLGMGDVVPRTGLAKWLTVSESGLGFAFLAIVIGYLPVIYQAFSRRELVISLLDARAGSPPTAGEILRRHRGDAGHAALGELLRDWERWSAEVLESHLSYPPLGYFRSQHANQSWLAALSVILDTCALLMVSVDGWCERQAQLTFAMARHAAVDLAQVYSTMPVVATDDRLSEDRLVRLRAMLAGGGVPLGTEKGVAGRLAEIRRIYEPYVAALALYLVVDVPPWMREGEFHDNWESSPWGKVRLADPATRMTPPADDHF